MNIVITNITSSLNNIQAINLYDGNLNTCWNSQSFAPQWIEVDLGYSQWISRIKLLSNQYPSPANTINVIYAGDTQNPQNQIAYLSETTINGEWLVGELNCYARYIRILTTSSPSWVSWREIVVERDDINQIGKKEDLSGVNRFYDKQKNCDINFKGNNYIRLNNDSVYGIYHSLFSTSWNELNIINDLIFMRTRQYNAIRVIIDTNTINNINKINTNDFLSGQYMNNVIKFLKFCESQNIYVIIALPFVPNNYLSNICDIADGTINPYYFCQNIIDAKKQYLLDFISKLNSSDICKNIILGYEIENEQFFELNKYPLTFVGTITAPNGALYNLPDDAQQMMDAGMVFWCNSLYDTISSITTSLIGVGFFGNINCPAQWKTRTYWAIQKFSFGGTKLDFIDLHIYPNPIYTLQNYVDSFSIPTNHDKIIILGEFGAYKNIYQAISFAASSLKDFENLMAASSFNFSGYFLWTWNTNEQIDLWNAMSENREINSAISSFSF